MIEHRIEKLERELRRFKLYAALLALALGALLLTGFRLRGMEDGVLHVRGIVIEDAAGIIAHMSQGLGYLPQHGIGQLDDVADGHAVHLSDGHRRVNRGACIAATGCGHPDARKSGFQACLLRLNSRYRRLGGWRRTCRSPTGSGPEGSSPNEFGTGCPSSLPP